MERRSDNRHVSAAPSGSQSVARALALLDTIAQAKQDCGVRDLARQSGLSTSIAQRLVSTLAEFGYLEQSPQSRKYRIGYKAFAVGNAYLSGSDVTEASLPELRMLADSYQLNTFLGVLRDRSVIYLAAIQSSGPIRISNAPGSKAWLHSTALGKALLADLDEADAAGLLGPPPYRRLTAKTKLRWQPLLADLRDVRRTGYAVCDCENLDDVFAIGAAVRDASGRAVAAISGALARHQTRDAEARRLAQLIKDAAARISRRLGMPDAAAARLPPVRVAPHPHSRRRRS
jgi:DNA-binding IclR family transcriptional regulator